MASDAGSASREEDNFHDSSSEEYSVQYGASDFEIKERRPCCCCVTAERFYHIMYVLLFLAYLTTLPLWAKWLIRAPMPYRYWHEDIAKWPLLPRDQTNLALKQDLGIGMSPVPSEQHSCNYSCGENYLGFRSNLMNFEVRLSMEQSIDAEAKISTLYPVLMASEDFEHWILVGDRRHAYPEPFFRSRSSEQGQVYVHKTDQCMSMPKSNESFTSQGVYIIGCVTWRPSGQEALSKLESVTKEDLNMHCDSVGGVCGWPCGSRIPSNRMEGCTADGLIDTDSFARRVPQSKLGAKVEMFACAEPESELSDHCTLSTKPMSEWPCYQCQQQQKPGMAGGFEGGGADPSGDDGEEYDPLDPLDILDRRRRLQGDDDIDVEDDVIVSKRFLSLPQMQVRVYDTNVPQGRDIFNTPRAFVFASSTLDGPWKPLYSDTDIKNVPVDIKLPKTPIQRGGTDLNSMRLEHMNWLDIRSESCFGKRGPMYLVACAVNQSIYDKEEWWFPHDPRFSLGQEVAPPPFNDRCVAVGGRCGHACVPRQPHQEMPFCDEGGYIKPEYLVGEVEIQYNTTKAVFIFVYVLLIGFGLKILMLCPGIFSPHRRAHDYDPDMTENFRYIVVVSPFATDDDNKGAMVRNLVGVVSCMPPDCRCRYHVAVNDEGHRNEMRICWQLFCKIVAAVPNFGGDSYEQNVRELARVWCSETRMMGLPQIGSRVAKLDDKCLDRLSGKTALRKLLKESRWRNWDKVRVAALESAMGALAEDLGTNYNKFTESTPYLDSIEDWTPKDPSSLPLRMHYTSRAKPLEDPRNIMVQHVAVGAWYYKVPKGANTEDWLPLRTRPKEMVYAMPDHDEEFINVPLRSSHGKAGGLNFVDNYMTVVARRPQNIYGDERDEAPCLFAVAEAFHQFQPDFMISCIPCFFRENGDLDVRVAFTQAPQHYPELSEKSDYMDCNSAQFFRLTSMIRNCSGGVTSCGTNAMWMIPPRDDDNIWERRVKRVRDQDKKRRQHLIEREFFHTGTKIEDTATTVDQVLLGKHSHFVNRKLAFGMAQEPTKVLSQQQRCTAGAVTLALQWVTNTSESSSRAKRNRWVLWATVFAFVAFLAALCWLVSYNNNLEHFVNYGWVDTGRIDTVINPVKDFFWSTVEERPHTLALFGQSFNLDVVMSMFQMLIIWDAGLLCCFFILFLITLFAKGFTKCCRCAFPNELRWWSRMVIVMDILASFVWFWSAFFWIGFNYYLALARVDFYFDRMGMMTFMLVVNLLNLALLVCNSMRYSVMESVDANEVAALSMDTMWRSNQLFFISAPIQLFGVVNGISDFVKYKFYGQDIGGSLDEDKNFIAVSLVKYWTTAMLLGNVVAWVCYFIYAWEYQSSIAACITITLISLDILHPCVFLWFGHVSLNPHELAKMTCFQCLTSWTWWKASIKSVVLESALASFLKYLPLAYFIFMPILALQNSYFGLTGAFMLVAMGPAH